MKYLLTTLSEILGMNRLFSRTSRNKSPFAKPESGSAPPPEIPAVPTVKPRFRPCFRKSNGTVMLFPHLDR